MAQQTINIGASPNDGTGTPLRTAFQYTNSNFSELYTAVGPSGNNIVVPGSATITGDLTVDTSTLKVDSANNRVGVNKSTPAVDLDVGGSARFQSVGTNWMEFGVNVLTSNQATGASIRSVVSSAGNPTYSWTGDSDTGLFNDSANSIGFAIGGSEGMRLNSTGLGVGVSPSATLDIRKNASGSRFLSYHTGGNGTVTAGADLNEMRCDDTTTAYNLLNINVLGTSRFLVTSTGNVGIGVTPSAGGGCLQLKSGITFPATQVASSDANTLDDYEEGTFTPNIAGTTPTYTTQIGRYTKIGNRVFVTIRLTINNAGDGEDYRISGLPFANSSAAIAAISVGYFANLKSAAAFLSGYINLSASQIVLTATTGSALTATNGFGGIGNSTDLAISAVYFV